MTYRPVDEFFGPPTIQRLPAFIHAGAAALLIAFVYSVSSGSPDTAAYEYMFRKKHVMSTESAAGFFALSSVFSMFRDSMRGVKIRSNWMEYRDLVSSVWPKVRRFRWAQIDQINFEKSGSISLDVWDGTREFLPKVRDMEGLRRSLEYLAVARAIPVRGGKGVDDLEPFDGDDE